MKPLPYWSIAIVGCIAAYLLGRFQGGSDELSLQEAEQEAVEQSNTSELESIDLGGELENLEAMDLAQSDRALRETIIELEAELKELREEHERVSVKHDVLTRSRQGFLRLGFDSSSSRLPLITEETSIYDKSSQ